MKPEAEESRKSVKQWLDDAATRDDGALLELNLALQAPPTNGLEQFAARADLQRRRTADKDTRTKAKQATEGERRLRAADRGENDSADDASESGSALEISGSREEVERLLAALGQAQVLDARFIAPPAMLTAREAKTDFSGNADRVGEAGDGRAAQPSADANNASPETFKGFGGAAGKSAKRFAPGATRGAAEKPGDQAAGGVGPGKVPQRLRVRLQLVP